MSLEDLKKEVGCGCMEDVVECSDPDPRLMASLELLSVLERLIETLLYSGLTGLDPDSAETRKPIIMMQMGFVREAAKMLEPALQTIEQYMTFVGSQDVEEDSTDDTDEMPDGPTLDQM
jgi:hypothetical protein